MWSDCGGNFGEGANFYFQESAKTSQNFVSSKHYMLVGGGGNDRSIDNCTSGSCKTTDMGQESTRGTLGRVSSRISFWGGGGGEGNSN